MDIAQDWAAYLMGNHLGMPPYVQQMFGIMSTTRSFLQPLINQATQKPDLATIALLLVIIFVSLKILNMLYQSVIAWIRLAWRLAFWGGLVFIGMWMYTRGPDGVAQDMQYWYNTWTGEYHYWKEQEQMAKVLRQKPAYTTRPPRWY